VMERICISGKEELVRSQAPQLEAVGRLELAIGIFLDNSKRAHIHN
jgi:hypothetical protein